MNFIFVEFLIIACLSLGITYVLFKYLKSYAEGQEEVLGKTIKYGGGLAGFVLVMFILSQTYDTLIKTESAIGHSADKTQIDLTGNWEMHMFSDSLIGKGNARISQNEDNRHFQITGQVKDISFTSDLGWINPSRKMIFVYENSLGEMGIGLGNIVKNRPDSILISYYDAYTYDYDFDTTGIIRMYRTE